MSRSVKFVHVLAPVAAGLLTIACSSGEGGNESDNLSASRVTTRIEGSIVEQLSAEPILNALVYTSPATDSVRTGVDGRFSITDDFNGPGQYEVIVEHDAYINQQKTVTVGADGIGTAEFILTSSAVGLHANQSQVFFTESDTRKTFRLSSNIPSTGYSIISSDNWLAVNPESGIINNRETALIEILLNRELLPDKSPVTSELIINADNGTRAVVIAVQINQSNSSFSSSIDAGTFTQSANNVNPDIAMGPADDEQQTSSGNDNETDPFQYDCRRPDIFRTGFRNPLEPLIQFAESAQLPIEPGQASAATLGYQIINPFFVDAVVITELGNLNIIHKDGDTTETSLSLYKWNSEDRLIILKSDNVDNASQRRASLSFGVQPGIYCYALYPLNTPFNNPENFTMRIEFFPAQ